MTLIGLILFMPTMLACCTLTVLYGKQRSFLFVRLTTRLLAGKAVIQERQYQKLLEAAVQRREERAQQMALRGRGRGSSAVGFPINIDPTVSVRCTVEATSVCTLR